MATAIRGRIVRLSNKNPLIDIEIQAIDVATGTPAATTTTSNAYGFYSLTGLTDAVYFANPLIADDDWTIQPDTNVIFGGDLYVPDSTTTPRVQITTNTHGGFAILGSGDTYDDSTGLGTYEVLFDYAAATPGLYFADGAAYIGSAGITISGTGTLNITQASTTGGTPAGVDMTNTFTPSVGGAAYAGWRTQLTKAGATAASALRGISMSVSNNGGGTVDNLIGALFSVKNGASAGESTSAYGVYVDATRAGGTIPSLHGYYFTDSAIATTNTYGARVKATGSASAANYGFYAENITNGSSNYGLYVGTMGTTGSDWAIYSESATQSALGGKLGLGSTTAPSTILHIRQDAAIEVRAQAAAGANSDYSAIVHSNTVASPTATASGQSMTLGLRGYDNAGTPALTTAKAYIQLKTTEAWTTAAQGTGIDFATTAATTTTRAVQLAITSASAVFTNGLGLRGTTPAASFSLDDVAANSGAIQSWRLNNSSNTASSDARLVIQTGGSSAGDAFIRFIIDSTTDWSLGIDNSVANDPFVLARSGTLGTTNIASFLAGSVTLADPYDIVLGTSTGTKIGTSTTQKLGFFNATPIVRGTAFTQTYSTATHTHSNITAAAPSAYVGGANGYSTTTKAQEVRDAAANLVTDMGNVKQVLNGLIDDLQALGLIG